MKRLKPALAALFLIGLYLPAATAQDAVREREQITSAEEQLPIGDTVTLTVVYGNDARSAALRQAFSTAPLAALKKQMHYEGYANSAADRPDWSLWASKRELPALIVQYSGQEVLIRSGSEITDYQSLARDLANSYDQCFRRRHGGTGGGSPPPDNGGDGGDSPAPPPPMPPAAPPVIKDNSSVSVTQAGVTISLGAFAVGCVVAGVVGFVHRTRGAR